MNVSLNRHRSGVRLIQCKLLFSNKVVQLMSNICNNCCTVKGHIVENEVKMSFPYFGNCDQYNSNGRQNFRDSAIDR